MPRLLESLDITTGSLRLRACRWSDPQATPGPQILALHGFTGDAEDYSPFPALSPAGTTWHALDFVGHGQSAAPDDISYYTPDACIHHLQAVEKQLALRDYFLVGYSMGGRSALHYALERPDNLRGLILIGANPGITDPAERRQRRLQDEALADHILRSNIKSFLAEWMEQAIISTQRNIPDDIRENMLLRRHRNNPIGLANALRGFGTGAMPLLWDRLSELQIPVLLLSGSEDMKYTIIARDMEMYLRRPRRYQILGAGHCAHLEYPQRFSRILTEFMQDTAAGAL